MSEISEQQIREYAHRLWEKDGSPEGRAEDYWHRAKAELDSDEQAPDTPAPMPE
ncbi:MAG: DUF2934 domain-containing protein [Hyphomicrobiales bacterium]|jgi:hypothetical protein|nr:DUF2934 domain-containing protein [Hyphomicrobiales bacterium]